MMHFCEVMMINWLKSTEIALSIVGNLDDKKVHRYRSQRFYASVATGEGGNSETAPLWSSSQRSQNFTVESDECWPVEMAAPSILKPGYATFVALEAIFFTAVRVFLRRCNVTRTTSAVNNDFIRCHLTEVPHQSQYVICWHKVPMSHIAYCTGYRLH